MRTWIPFFLFLVALQVSYSELVTSNGKQDELLFAWKGVKPVSLNIKTTARSSMYPTCTLQSNGCYKKCMRWCSHPIRGVHPTPCGENCEKGCWQKGCKALMRGKCTQTCTGSGNCWSKCSKCCTPDGVCQPGICPAVCFPPGCGLNPPPSPSPKKCEWTCKGSGGCYSRCRKCCGANGVCTTGICDLACRPKGCSLSPIPTPAPQMHTCDWTCTRVGGCYQYCRKCCLDGRCTTTSICTKSCWRNRCPSNGLPAPQKAFCFPRCALQNSKFSRSPYIRCTCCCLNGKCKDTECTRTVLYSDRRCTRPK